MAIIDPWEGNPYDTGRPPSQGLPSLEELMQQGNVQVQREGPTPEQIGQSPGPSTTKHWSSDPSIWSRNINDIPMSSLAAKYQSLRSLYNMAANAPAGTSWGQMEALKSISAPLEKEVRVEEEAERVRETEEKQIRMKGEEQRKGFQMQEELKMQGQREQQAAEQAGVLERLRKTPLSGLLGMTLEQFDALPPEQKEQYRKAVMMQSGGFGKVMENLTTIIQQMPEGPAKENMLNYAMALAESLFTRQNVEDLLNRTVDPKGNLRLRHKRLDVAGASPGIRPGGQPYGPEEEPVGLGPGLIRSFGRETNAPPPGMGEPGVDMGMFTAPSKPVTQNREGLLNALSAIRG